MWQPSARRIALIVSVLTGLCGLPGAALGSASELRVVAVSGRPSSLDLTTRRFFVTDYDVDGPITTEVETGFGFDFVAIVLGNGNIRVELRLTGGRLAEPVATQYVATPVGLRAVQAPQVESFVLDSFTIELVPGQPAPIQEPGVPGFTLTATALTSPVVEVAIGGLAFDVNPLAANAAAKQIRLTSLSGRPATALRETQRHFVTGFVNGLPTGPDIAGPGPDVSDDGLRTGDRIDFVPIVLGNGRIRLEVRIRCSQLGASVGGFGVQTPHGSAVVQQPVLHTLSIDTATELNDQEAQTIAHAVADGTTAQFDVRPVRIPSGGGASLVRLEADATIAGAGLPDAAPTPTPMQKQFDLVTLSGRPAGFFDGRRQRFITGYGPDASSTSGFPAGVEDVRQFGRRLDFVPILLGGGVIRLEVRPGCSRVEHPVPSYGFPSAFGPLQVQQPVIHETSVDTGVEILAGTTLALASIVSNGSEVHFDALPELVDSNTVRLRSQVAIDGGGPGHPSGSSFSEVLELTTPSGVSAEIALPTQPTVESFDLNGDPVLDTLAIGPGLAFVPIILGNQDIRAEIRVDVTQIAEQSSLGVITPSGLHSVDLPVIEQTFVDTGIEVGDGQTLGIAGLQNGASVSIDATLDNLGPDGVRLTINAARDLPLTCPCFDAADLAPAPIFGSCVALNAWAGFYTEYYAWPSFYARAQQNYCLFQPFAGGGQVTAPLTPAEFLLCRQLLVGAANNAGVTCFVY